MKSLAIALCLVILVGVAPASAAGEQLLGLRITGEQSLGAVKCVSGKVVPSTVDRPWTITVWVNGISGQVAPTGEWRVMIPSEEVASIMAFQPGSNVTVIAVAQAEGGMKQAVVKGSEGIRDLLKNGEGIRDLLKSSEGIRDLLGGGKVSSEGIRDLLSETKAKDDGIRDLLRKGKGSSEGIRDLLSETRAKDDGIRDLLPKGKGSSEGIRDLLGKPSGNDEPKNQSEGIRDLLPR